MGRKTEPPPPPRVVMVWPDVVHSPRASKTPEPKIVLTQQQCLDAKHALRTTITLYRNAMSNIDRKRTWRDSEKAMAKAQHQQTLEALMMLEDKIKRATPIAPTTKPKEIMK